MSVLAVSASDRESRGLGPVHLRCPWLAPCSFLSARWIHRAASI